ncbi:MAG: diaminopimelate epimerase [Bacteroidota bacterium]
MSKPSLIVEFTKMQAAGNDFIIVDNRFYYFSAQEQSYLAKKWCDRHFGIGADGLVVLGVAANDTNHVTMRHYNPDGKEATLCGNGTRCAALYALNVGMAEASDVQLLTGAGLLTAHVQRFDHAEDRVTVKMPTPTDWRVAEIETQARSISVAQVWTGTEHAVYEQKEGIDFLQYAPMVRSHESMGEKGVNVNQLEVIEPGRARIRTFEKGVEEETLACGTGAVAAAVYLARLHGSQPDVLLHANGGDLRAYKRADNWYLEGPAAAVYRGTFEYNGQV